MLYEFSLSTRYVPAMLRRPLLYCVLGLLAGFMSCRFATVMRAGQEVHRNTAYHAVQNTETALAVAREAEGARAALAQRRAALSAVLETLGTPPGETEWKRLALRFAQDPRITKPDLNARVLTRFSAPGQPVVSVQRLSVEAGLLHEEALLALVATVMDGPAHVVPVGCGLRREDSDGMPLRAHCEFDWIALDPHGEPSP